MKKNNREVFFKGVDDSYFNDARQQEFILNSTQILNDESSRFARLYISDELASYLGVSVGDKVAIITLPSTQNMKVRPSLATIVGLYSSGYQKIDESLILLISIMQKNFLLILEEAKSLLHIHIKKRLIQSQVHFSLSSK